MRKHLLVLAAGALVGAVTLVPAAASGGAATVRDGIPDSWQIAHRLTLRVNQASLDADRDLLKNLYEYRAHTNPRRVDTDRDGVRDPYEDYDRDGLTNLQEQVRGLHPADVDSDNDGLRDDGEDNNGDDENGDDDDGEDDDEDDDEDGDDDDDGEDDDGEDDD
jgi:hypothetical protein